MFYEFWVVIAVSSLVGNPVSKSNYFTKTIFYIYIVAGGFYQCDNLRIFPLPIEDQIRRLLMIGDH